MSSGDEGEWEAEEEQEDDEDSQEESYHDDDDDSNSDRKPAARRTIKEGEDAAGTKRPTSSSKPDRRKRLRRVDFDAEGDDNEIDRLPSHQRLTHKGGYMHTKNSRLKISQANKGKSPWNKGKNRSETAKAKISAGVRARNHAILLIKLGKLGLTEEEWFRKKKQIKLLRERVRKAKVSAAKYEETKKQEMLEKTTERGDALKKQLAELMRAIGTDEESNDEKETVAAATSGAEMDTSARNDERPTNPAVTSSDDGNQVAAVATVEIADDDTTAVVVGRKQPPTISIFARDYRWTPHIFDSKDISYNMLCPHGGPGGLICCNSCTASYAKYLTKTHSDMETQTMAKVGDEVKELLDFTRDAKQKLAQTIKVARRKPVPIRRNHTSNADSPTTTRKAAPPAVETTTAGPSMEFAENMQTEQV